MSLKDKVRAALEPIIERAMHPEKFSSNGGHLIGKRRPDYDPLTPKQRLQTRLTLLVALREIDLQILRESTADLEALKDAASKPGGKPLIEILEMEAGTRCAHCRREHHGVCPMTPGCPCCDNTAQRSAP